MKRRLAILFLPLVPLGVASSYPGYKTPWWRTGATVRPGGAVFRGPEGAVMVCADLPSGRDYTIVRPNGVVLSPNRPRLETPWFVLPVDAGGVLVALGGKADHDARLRRSEEGWSFAPLLGRSGERVEVVGDAPFVLSRDRT